MDYLNKMNLTPTQNAWKNGYHLNIRFGSIDFETDNFVDITSEEKYLWEGLDKIFLPVLKKETDLFLS